VSTVSRLHSTLLGELPPPPPRDCFGRDGLIEEVVRFAENLEPVALTGSGGIGKTSIALAVLHHNLVKERFGENRRFIRCDQFPPSRAHFLARLSKVIGAGVENPEDLTSLQPSLSSKETFIILDNAESVLDPQGTDAQEIYSVVDELCRFKNICLLITSRITTVPPPCNRPKILTLSMEAACDIFYNIHGNRGESGIINDLLHRLDFHALSITLLATTASHNAWDHDRLAKEWDAQRARVLQTNYNESLASTIELSLASPTFCSLDPNARDLLEVIAFFPQGINEKNLDWLFPTIFHRKQIFGTLCLLSLAYRSNGFVTMLAPIRDYLCPQDPRSSPLLCTTRDRYFKRLSVTIGPGRPGFGEARWVVSEDVNVEHLLNVFTSINPNAGDIWDVCYHFMEHLRWHKPQPTILGPKIKSLADDHPSKMRCLFGLSRLLREVGNYAEQKRILTQALELERRQGNGAQVAATLRRLSDVNRLLCLHEEGIKQGREALEIFERIGKTKEQAMCLYDLAHVLFDDKQFDAAEKAASRAIDLIPEKGLEYTVCRLHWVLGRIHHSRREKREAIHCFDTAFRIASPFDWHGMLFWIHFSLAALFRDETEFNDANTHIELAKSHAIDGTLMHNLGDATEMRASIWYRQRRLEEAKSEASHALEIYEKLGAAKGAGGCQSLLQKIERAMERRSTRPPGELFGTTLHPM
jgi:tetratricopeptide (TPR) repeat protein